MADNEYFRPEYTPVFSEVQDFIADSLNKDVQLSSAGIVFHPEHALDIEYEIQKHLGQQGIVGIVNTLKGEYHGHNGDTQAWQIDAEIDVIENPPVRRAQMKKMGLSSGTTTDLLDWIQESMCGPSSPTYGRFSSRSQELGESNGLIVGKATMRTFAMANVSAVVSGETAWHIPYALQSDLSALSVQVQGITDGFLPLDNLSSVAVGLRQNYPNNTTFTLSAQNINPIGSQITALLLSAGITPDDSQGYVYIPDLQAERVHVEDTLTLSADGEYLDDYVNALNDVMDVQLGEYDTAGLGGMVQSIAQEEAQEIVDGLSAVYAKQSNLNSLSVKTDTLSTKTDTLSSAITAVSTQLTEYLPLSGGSMSGDIEMGGNNAQEDTADSNSILFEGGHIRIQDAILGPGFGIVVGTKNSEEEDWMLDGRYMFNDTLSSSRIVSIQESSNEVVRSKDVYAILGDISALIAET